MDRALLNRYGINYDEGLQRCANNPVFYRRLLTMFLEDDCFRRARLARDARDWQTLFGCMHELKGVAGNIAMYALYETVTPMVELLRDDPPDEARADRQFAAVEAAYERTYEGVALAVAAE